MSELSLPLGLPPISLTPTRDNQRERESLQSFAHVELSTARSPLATRLAYSNHISSVSPRKRKDVDGDEGRYGDAGLGRGVRAEGSPAPRRPATNTFHLPGHPRLPSLSSFTPRNISLRGISQTYAPTSHYSSMAEHQIFNDLPAGLLMQHTGDVSDSSFFNGGLDLQDAEDDLVDAGDVSLQLVVELELELELELAEEQAPAHTSDAERFPTPKKELFPPSSGEEEEVPQQGSTAGPGMEMREEIANRIGEPGYVPSRIKAIETHQRRPILAASPQRPNKKQRFIFHHDADADTIPLPASPAQMPLPTSADRSSPSTSPIRLTDVAPALGAVSATSLPDRTSADFGYESLPDLDLPLPSASAAIPDPILELTDRINLLLSQNLTLSSENSTLTSTNSTLALENTTLLGERAALWRTKRANDLRITELEAEKANLKADIRASQADKEELEVGFKGVMTVCEKLEGMVKDVKEEGEGGARTIAETVVKMSRAGMLDANHWSNQGGRGVLQKRKEYPDSSDDSPSKRTCR